MQEGIYLTEEGRAKIEAELRRLISVQRTEIADRIRATKQVRDFGDDSEFEDAKMAQALIESRIADLQSLLKRAQLVTRDEIPTNEVGVGSIVHVRNIAKRREETFIIVGAAEADPATGRISNQSPVGQALMGAKVNDVVEVLVPAGSYRYRIKSIRRPRKKRSESSSVNGGAKRSKTAARSSRRASKTKAAKSGAKSRSRTKTKKAARKTKAGKARTKKTATRKTTKSKTKSAAKRTSSRKSSSRSKSSASKTRRKSPSKSKRKR